MAKKILCADIGGTKTIMGVFALSGGSPVLEKLHRAPTSSLPSAEEGLSSFLSGEKVDVISLGVAGCVLYGEITAPNLPWKISAEGFSRFFGNTPVIITNDVAASAVGTLELPEESFSVIQSGSKEPFGTRALLAAGTGLGEAVLACANGTWITLASEGGHRDFCPTNDLEFEFYLYLKNIFGHVSVERVVSGPGLVMAYEFLIESGRYARSRDLAEKMRLSEPALVIAEEGGNGTDYASAAALSLFSRSYGSQAGNLALSALPTGGLYVGGGIIASILPSILKTGFLESFLNKGRLRRVLEHIPVIAIIEPKSTLFGAARKGADFLSQRQY